MIANHIHDALAQVRTLQALMIERNLFKGYSGKARILGGIAALAGAAILGSGRLPRDPWIHLAGWGFVLAAGLFLNYVALLYWFLAGPGVRRNPLMLKPALDALPPLLAGACLSVALIVKGQFALLFGSWMCFYGLTHAVYRRTLPPANYGVGLFYLACGVACWFWPGLEFTNPWPMGAVFAAGEVAGGSVLLADSRRATGREEAPHE